MLLGLKDKNCIFHRIYCGAGYKRLCTYLPSQTTTQIRLDCMHNAFAHGHLNIMLRTLLCRQCKGGLFTESFVFWSSSQENHLSSNFQSKANLSVCLKINVWYVLGMSALL